MIHLGTPQMNRIPQGMSFIQNLLLVVLLQLVLLVISPELWRSARLSHRWGVKHAVLQWDTTGATFGGSWHGPLSLLLFSHFTGLHGPFLVNGGAGQLIKGQVGV
jgi:hypothetical protein